MVVVSRGASWVRSACSLILAGVAATNSILRFTVGPPLDGVASIKDGPAVSELMVMLALPLVVFTSPLAGTRVPRVVENWIGVPSAIGVPFCSQRIVRVSVAGASCTSAPSVGAVKMKVSGDISTACSAETELSPEKLRTVNVSVPLLAAVYSNVTSPEELVIALPGDTALLTKLSMLIDSPAIAPPSESLKAAVYWAVSLSGIADGPDIERVVPVTATLVLLEMFAASAVIVMVLLVLPV